VRSILEEARERDILVLLDEDCMDFVEDEKRFFLAGEVEKYPNLFTLRSFTKFFALPGLRIGYGVASKNMVELLSKAKVPWNINCLAQAAALKALENRRYQQKTRETIKKERHFLTVKLESFMELRVYPSEANFILINIENTCLTADKVKERMLEHRILIRDCNSFRGLNHHYIRVTVRSRRENTRLIKALRKVLR
jgi:threonine-phosphate decarboxylase